MTTHRRLSAARQQTLLQIVQHKTLAIKWTDLVNVVEEVGEIAPTGGRGISTRRER